MADNKNTRPADTLASGQRDECGKAEQLPLYQAEEDGNASDDTSSSEFTEEELEKARRTRDRAKAWRRRNPHAYGMFDRFGCEYAGRGVEFGANLLKELVRYKDIYIDRGDEPFRIPNDFAPVIARWFKAEHPEYAHLVRTRRCALDVVMQEEEEPQGEADNGSD